MLGGPVGPDRTRSLEGLRVFLSLDVIMRSMPVLCAIGGFVFVAILLTGCESTPKTVVQEGTRFTGQIAGTPTDAARCVAKNAEPNLNGLLASFHELDGGVAEVLIRVNARPITNSVWHFRQRGGVTGYEVSVNRAIANKEGHIREMRGTC